LRQCYNVPARPLKRALRFITSSPFRTITNPLFKKLNLLKVVDIHKYQSLQFIFKFKNMLLPKCCLNFCTFSDDGKYNTRCHSYLKTRAFRTSIYQRSIRVAGPCMWDSLPSNIKEMNCLSLFKRNLTLYLTGSYI